jgi:hypothetical protein
MYAVQERTWRQSRAVPWYHVLKGFNCSTINGILDDNSAESLSEPIFCIESRVARLHILKLKITHLDKFWSDLEWKMLVCLLVYFTAIRYSLRPFGIHSLRLFAIFYNVLVNCTKINLATPIESDRRKYEMKCSARRTALPFGTKTVCQSVAGEQLWLRNRCLPQIKPRLLFRSQRKNLQ